MNDPLIYVVRKSDGTESAHPLPKLVMIFQAGNFPHSTIVREQNQDSWYPIGELMGTAPTRPLLMPCPQCKNMIKARRIDQGILTACPKCRTEVRVPNVDRKSEAMAVRRHHDHARADVIKATLFLIGGTALTVSSWIFRDQDGTFFFWWGPMTFGLGSLLCAVPALLRIRRLRAGKTRRSP